MDQDLRGLSHAQLIKMRNAIDNELRPMRIQRLFAHLAMLRNQKVQVSVRVQNLSITLDGIYSLGSLTKELSVNDQERIDDLIDELEAILVLAD